MQADTKVTLTGTIVECPDGSYVLVRVDGASGPSRGLLPVLRTALASADVTQSNDASPPKCNSCGCRPAEFCEECYETRAAEAAAGDDW